MQLSSRAAILETKRRQHNAWKPDGPVCVLLRQPTANTVRHESHYAKHERETPLPRHTPKPVPSFARDTVDDEQQPNKAGPTAVHELKR